MQKENRRTGEQENRKIGTGKDEGLMGALTNAKSDRLISRKAIKRLKQEMHAEVVDNCSDFR
ncbi:hypothetical protein B4V20_20325 [Shigella dysenteriae]|nr:hypothetical protein [Shigella dysenteriae]